MLRKYTKTAAMTAASYFGESPLFLLDYALRLLRVIVLLSIWRVLFAGKGSVAGISLGAVLTYSLISETFAEQLYCQTDLISSFWNGSITTRYLRPMSVFSQFSVEMYGKWSVNFAVFSLPLLVCAPLFGVDPLPHSPLNGLLFLVSLALAVWVGLAIEFIFCALAVVWEMPAYAVERVRGAVSVLLSGAFIPLALMPWGIGRVFGWLPFAATASTPLRIYTGTGAPLPLMLAQLGWAIPLWLLAKRLWRINQEKMVSYGG